MFLLIPAYPGSPGQTVVKRLCVCVYYCLSHRKMAGEIVAGLLE